MAPELWPVIALIVMFLVGTILNINLGVLALATTFFIGVIIAGIPLEEVYLLFPGDMYILLLALMLFLSVARQTGAIEWLVRVAVAGVRGRIILLPWVLFALSALVAALGPGAILFLAGIGLELARRYKVSRLLIAVLIVHGTQAGGFSPVSPYSALVGGIVQQTGYVFEPMVLFGGAFAFNTVAAVVGFSALGGWKIRRSREHAVSPVGAEVHASVDAPAPALEERTVALRRRSISEWFVGDPAGESLRPTMLQVVTLIALVILVVVVGAFRWDLGVAALLLAVVLLLLLPGRLRTGVLPGVSWAPIVLIVGMITFMALATRMGMVEWAADGLLALGSPLIALLLACYIAGIVSALASSFATLAVILPIVLSVSAGIGLDGWGATLVAAAIVVSATIVDVSPFSSYGAIVLGAAQPGEQNAFQRILLAYAGVIVVAAPAVAWACLILPVWATTA